jgi:hypothetical protein
MQTRPDYHNNVSPASAINRGAPIAAWVHSLSLLAGHSAAAPVGAGKIELWEVDLRDSKGRQQGREYR